MKIIIAICFVASALALSGCQKDESGSEPAPNNAPAAGMNTNAPAMPPPAGTNAP